MRTEVWKNGILVDVVETQPTEAEYKASLKQFLDAKAKERGWDSIDSVTRRAGYTGPYQEEAIKYAQWADSCWVEFYEALKAMEESRLPMLQEDGMISRMPELVL